MEERIEMTPDKCYNKDSLSFERGLFDNKIDWLDSKEAAEYLRITVAGLKSRVAKGQITIHGRLGKSWRFNRNELNKLLVTSTKENSND